MKNKDMLLNSILAAVLGIALLIAMVWRTFQPYVVFPVLNIPSMAGLMLIALLIEYFVSTDGKRFWIVQTVLAGITFGVLPWAAGLIAVAEMPKMMVVSGLLFLSLLFIFTAVTKRLKATLVPKTAAVPIAFVLFMAYQCFAGIFI